MKRIPEETTIDIVRFLENISSHIRLIHEDVTVGNREDLPGSLFARIKWTPGDSGIYAQQFVDSLYDYLLKTPLSPLQIDAYIQNEKELMDTRAGLMAMFDHVEIQESFPGKLTLIPKSVAKTKAVRYLAKSRGIALDEMVIIGCDADEEELVRHAGLGVAVANAADEVKRRARWLTRTNDELGVAYLIKEVFRRQHPIGFLKKMNIKVDK